MYKMEGGVRKMKELKLRSDRHLWLFAKGWYKYKGDPFPPLQIIISEYCGCKIDKYDVLRFVLQRVEEIEKLDPNFRISQFIELINPRAVRWTIEPDRDWEFNYALLIACLHTLRFAKLTKEHLGEIDETIKMKIDNLKSVVVKDKV